MDRNRGNHYAWHTYRQWSRSGGGSIVTHPVADYEIVAGSPARHIGWRFEDSVREELQKIEWWNYSDEVLRDNIDLFSPFNDITKDTKIINKLKEIKQ